MKMTKAHRQQLKQVESNLRRGIEYLHRPDVMGIAVAVDNPNGSDYTINNPACIGVIPDCTMHVRAMNKQIGSDIAGLYQALNQLQDILEGV